MRCCLRKLKEREIDMKAIRKKDGKVIEVSSLEYTDIETNVKSRYCAADGEMYPLSDLDFSVGEAKESESDLRISVAKLREILEQTAKDYKAPQYFIDEIINQVKQSI